MSNSVILDVKRHELLTVAQSNELLVLNNSLVIRDKVSNDLIMIPDTLDTRKVFNCSQTDNNSESSIGIDSLVSSDAEASGTGEHIQGSNNNSEKCNTNPPSSDCTTAKWTNANAVRVLISKWKDHENDFKSTLIRNNKVWQMIANDLKKENPLWSFTGTQCENKFKDIRKSYTKIKDHNNQSGAELKTCKFYDDMEAALGEKPIVKPISISSTLKKRVYPSPKRAVSPCSSESCDEKENVSLKESKINKKSKIAKELDKWSVQQRALAEEREQARMQRHKEKMERQDQAIAAYKEQMEKLFEKL